MPSSVSDLLETVEINLTGSVRWNDPIESNKCGIYIVSLSKSPSENCSILKSVPIDLEIVNKWSQVCGLKLDFDSNPSAEAITQRINEFWLPDESILYIGQTTRQFLNRRINQFYRHKLGNSSPHRGGHWLKTLSILSRIFVYYAETNNPKKVEQQLIEAFADGVSSNTIKLLRDSEHPFPFANLELRKERKSHGIRNQTKK